MTEVPLPFHLAPNMLQVFLEKAGGCVVEALARFLFQQLVIALDFCHRRGKVNRNIRPSGLLLQLGASALPLLKLSDFSVSKDTLRHSQPRSQVGTAMYCAPEVLCNFRGAAYDAAAADVWSVGVVLFSMLFGRHPYARPEDAALPAAQQVIAMFKRVTAPAGSVDGDLYIPAVLPTSILPGAQPGVPLSPAAAHLLRGLLARDPRARLTLDGVQQHDWFRTGLPEGAALLNEVVAAEEVEAGEAAVMSPAAAAQLERMVLAASTGPASLSPCVPGRVERPAESAADAGAAQLPTKDSVDPVPQAKRTRGGLSPQEQQQATSPPPQHHPPPPPQALPVARTITTGTSSDMAQTTSAALASSTPPSQPASSRAATTSGGGAGEATALAGVGAEAAEPGHAGEELDPAMWSAFSGDSGKAVDAGSDDEDGLLSELEELVRGVPEDDLMQAASLDFMLSASLLQQAEQQQQKLAGTLHHHHQQQQQQHAPPVHAPGPAVQPVLQPQAPPQRPLSPILVQPQPHQASPQLMHLQEQPAASGTTSGLPVHVHAGAGFAKVGCGLSNDDSAPASADTAGSQPGQGGWHSPQLQVQQPSLVDLHTHANGAAANGVTPTATSAAAQRAGFAQAAHGVLGGSQRFSGAPSLPLFASLRSMASGSHTYNGDYAASLLARLRTDSLPSPQTLAVVDARPFLAAEPGDNSGSLRRESSMMTIPSTYTIDWCTLSARSENLLSPRMLGAGGSNGGGGMRPDGSGGGGPGMNGLGGGAGGSDGGAGAGRGSAGGGPSPLLLQGSVWHRICHEARGALQGTAAEARGLGRAAAQGLGQAASAVASSVQRSQ
ncbi:hypothetical protein GPECTOR_6g854 [Gonium pectorale]|uniref:Protein kinase domain-containing protein n=1 Tax=Gonium pectorale TaxID=33097 RepID=A0A150GVM9_GONPE|nr:hypothetical protein GPECTOR_6g854 [Gonium pectorale]|eukprot:KXZ53936.1 hypothetical protein GPECTOR_6g854 [Gonium pectorale]